MNFAPVKSFAVAAVAALLVSACATATPYQPAGFNGQRGGYAEQRLESDRYRVSFSGNSVTSREQVESGLLLRAAELTQESGFDWFATVNRATDRDVRYSSLSSGFAGRGYGGFGYYSPFFGPSWRYSRGGLWSRWNDPFYNDFDVRQIDRFEASTEIIMGRGPKPSNDPNAFDAREVQANLSGYVPRPG